MKVLQINTVGNSGSTGRTTKELSLFIEENGFTSYVAFGHGKITAPDFEFKIGKVWENHLHNFFSRFSGKQGYFSKSGTLMLIKFIEDLNPDIIHLRNLHGNYLNIALLFSFLSRNDIPIVWTIHDCWAFTGKCTHYTDVNCYRWQTECFDCPQVSKYPSSVFFDKSKLMFNDKKRLFTSIKNMFVVPVSDWLLGELSKSFLNKYSIKRIYNWIDLNTFKPNYSSERAKYGLTNEQFIVLGVSAGWKKNDKKLKDFIQLNELLQSSNENIRLVLLGKEKDKGCIPESIIHIPYTDSKESLASIYSMSDVYVHLATEDTFGKVLAEAMACGLPLIAYNSTVYPEIIKDGCGFTAAPSDLNEIYRLVKKVKVLGKDVFSDNCISIANKYFSYRNNANEYISIYKEILKANLTN